MKRLPSVPRLAEGASFTEFIRRVAAMHHITEQSAVKAMGLSEWHRGGPSAFDSVGFTPDERDRIVGATGASAERVEALTLPRSFPALANLRKFGSESDRFGKSWDTRGIHRTDAPACTLCLTEDPLAFPLAWRIGFLPICIRHAVYLAPLCPQCRRFGGRAVLVNPNSGRKTYCRGKCTSRTPQVADAAALEAQTRLRGLLAAPIDGDGALRTTLDYAWFLRHSRSSGTRARSEAPSPHDMGRILTLATDWSLRDPQTVATEREFLEVPARRLHANRPFASASLRTAFYARGRNASNSQARTAGPIALERMRHPDYLPLDLHLRFTADLIHDGWTRDNPPTLHRSRRVAAYAVTSQAGRWRSHSAAAVAGRLEERGQLDEWLVVLNRVRDELRRTPRIFGATWQDLETFTANFQQDHLAHYPSDAATIWFLRDHRCADLVQRLGWSASRKMVARSCELQARRRETCGPWDLIQERLAQAAAVADAQPHQHAQTA